MAVGHRSGPFGEKGKNMRSSEMETLIEDFRLSPLAGLDPDLGAVEAALFIEQTFGIVLSDDEISPAVIGSKDAIKVFVESRAGSR